MVQRTKCEEQEFLLTLSHFSVHVDTSVMVTLVQSIVRCDDFCANGIEAFPFYKRGSDLCSEAEGVWGREPTFGGAFVEINVTVTSFLVHPILGNSQVYCIRVIIELFPCW